MQQDQKENQSLLDKLALWIGTERRLFIYSFFVFPSIPILPLIFYLIACKNSIFNNNNFHPYYGGGTILDGIALYYIIVFYIPFLLFSFVAYINRRVNRPFPFYIGMYLLVLIPEFLFLSIFWPSNNDHLLLGTGASNIILTSFFVLMYKSLLKYSQ